MKPKIVIVPGNGDSHIESDNWYAWVRGKLIGMGYRVNATDMPDPIAAHMNIWLPYIEQELQADESSVIIGHSSGAVAALRYLESHRLLGAILIGCNFTDLGDQGEKESGWYDSDWKWDEIKNNAGFIVQFLSDNDPYIPASEPLYIHQRINSELLQLPDRGHFMTDHNPLNRKFPELIEVIKNKLPL